MTETPGWFDPASPPAEAPQTTAPAEASAEKLEVAKTDAPPGTETGKLAADARPVLVHLAHAIDAVDKFAREHPGLDAIFVNGLKTALLALEHVAA